MLVSRTKKRFFWAVFLSLTLLSTPRSLLWADEQKPIATLNISDNSQISIEPSEQKSLKIAINTEGLEKDLQGSIPVSFLLERDETTFENGEKTLQWHKKLQKENAKVVNSPVFYMNLEISEALANKPLQLKIIKEEDISRAAIFFSLTPQILPFFIPGNVDPGNLQHNGPLDFVFRSQAMSYKLFDVEMMKFARELLEEQMVFEKKSLLAQCSIKTAEGLAMLRTGFYEGGDAIRGDDNVARYRKTDMFRRYLKTGAIKRLMDCMSDVVTEALLGMNNNFFNGSKMNSLQANGFAKLLLGYNFNLFAYEAGDFLKLLRLELQSMDFHDPEAIGRNLDASLIKATQFTIHEGYEAMFRGTLKARGLNEAYAIPMTEAAAALEIVIRLLGVANINHIIDSGNRRQVHTTASIYHRIEAMTVTVMKSVKSIKMNKQQQVVAGVAIPFVVNLALMAAVGHYQKSSLIDKSMDSFFNGVVSSSLSLFIAPILQSYALVGIRKIQKPLVDYLNIGEKSYTKRLLANSLRYRIVVDVDTRE